jgi:hypothetical protein
LRSLTALQKLHITGSAGGETSQQADNVLAPLSALQRLTSLQLQETFVRRRQLEHLRVPLLLELAIKLEPPQQGNAVQLQLGHLTSLSKLIVSERAAPMQLEDTLPQGLQELEFTVANGRHSHQLSHGCSFQPLLRLQQLRKLQLRFFCVPGASEVAVRQLSRLGSLQELHMTYDWRDTEARTHGDAAAASSAWTGLPLKSLSWRSEDVPIAVIERVGHLQGLTSLEWTTNFWGPGTGLEATPGQLAAILQPLTGLRRLHLHGYSCLSAADEGICGSDPCSNSGSDARAVAVSNGLEGVAALLRCVGGLRKVEEVDMSLLIRLSGSDVQLLQGMMWQLLPSYMGCKVQADRIILHLR